MMKFRTKPVDVEAVQFVDFDSGVYILEWVGLNGGHASLTCGSVPKLVLHSGESKNIVLPGDWVVLNGGFSVVPPQIFRNDYEAAGVSDD